MESNPQDLAKLPKIVPIVSITERTPRRPDGAGAADEEAQSPDGSPARIVRQSSQKLLDHGVVVDLPQEPAQDAPTSPTCELQPFNTLIGPPPPAAGPPAPGEAGLDGHPADAQAAAGGGGGAQQDTFVCVNETDLAVEILVRPPQEGGAPPFGAAAGAPHTAARLGPGETKHVAMHLPKAAVCAAFAEGAGTVGTFRVFFKNRAVEANSTLRVMPKHLQNSDPPVLAQSLEEALGLPGWHATGPPPSPPSLAEAAVGEEEPAPAGRGPPPHLSFTCENETGAAVEVLVYDGPGGSKSAAEDAGCRSGGRCRLEANETKVIPIRRPKAFIAAAFVELTPHGPTFQVLYRRRAVEAGAKLSILQRHVTRCSAKPVHAGSLEDALAAAADPSSEGTTTHDLVTALARVPAAATALGSAPRRMSGGDSCDSPPRRDDALAKRPSSYSHELVFSDQKGPDSAGKELQKLTPPGSLGLGEPGPAGHELNHSTPPGSLGSVHQLATKSDVGSSAIQSWPSAIKPVQDPRSVGSYSIQTLQQSMAGVRSAYTRLMNNATRLARRPGDVGKAYLHICEANALHIRTYGAPSAEAFCGLARCLSLGVATLLEPDRDPEAPDPAPELPPCLPGAQLEELAKARLDLAISMLQSAAVAGYKDADRLASDKDLRTLREQRPDEFSAVLTRMQGSVVAVAKVETYPVVKLKPCKSPDVLAEAPGTDAPAADDGEPGADLQQAIVEADSDQEEEEDGWRATMMRMMRLIGATRKVEQSDGEDDEDADVDEDGSVEDENSEADASEREDGDDDDEDEGSSDSEVDGDGPGGNEEEAARTTEVPSNPFVAFAESLRQAFNWRRFRQSG